jgi:DNA (cytosine-5)-methyltransferase 1
MPHTVVSLFAGCGGFDIGFKEKGFDLIYACDVDPVAVECYKRNVDPRAYVRDVTEEKFKIDIKTIGQADVVLGGFPCQGFSKAGPKKEEDSRNLLYHEMKFAVGTLNPKIFVAENVDGLSQNFKGKFLDQIVQDFGELGYEVKYRVLDAISYGVAQHRRRIFFIGTKPEVSDKFQWPSPTHEKRVRNGEKDYDSENSLFDFFARNFRFK